MANKPKSATYGAPLSRIDALLRSKPYLALRNMSDGWFLIERGSYSKISSLTTVDVLVLQGARKLHWPIEEIRSRSLTVRRFASRYSANASFVRRALAELIQHLHDHERRTALEKIYQERAAAIRELPAGIIDDPDVWWGVDASTGIVLVDRLDQKNVKKLRIVHAVRCKDWEVIELLRKHMDSEGHSFVGSFSPI